MNDYWPKYRKYKTKYLTLKNQIGNGSQSKDNNLANFLDRAKNTEIENEYEILFNLLLVKNGLRPAYLLEVANYRHIKPDKLLSLIKSIYPEFNYTTEYEIDQKPHRIFIHLKPLTVKEEGVIGGKLYQQWIAENLGFHCKGIPGRNIDRISISYILNIKNEKPIGIYDEICPKDNYNEKYFNDKLLMFNELAEKLGWSVTMSINDMLANRPEYLLNLLLTNKLKEGSEEEVELVTMLRGHGLVSIYENIVKGNYTFNDLLMDKRLLLFKLLQLIWEPESVFWPLSTDTSASLRQVETEIFSTLEIDPLTLFKQYEKTDIMKSIMSGEPEKMRIYKSKRDKMISQYKELVVRDGL